ncbi:hypothetical protein J6590_101767, partial [Homalodisca vitripennis]
MSTQLNFFARNSRHVTGINNAVGCGLRTIRKELTKCGTTFMPEHNCRTERDDIPAHLALLQQKS